MNAIIYKVNLSPRIVVNSIITIWCIIPEIDQIAVIEDNDTIERLSEKHGFTIISKSEWDLTPMFKKECTLFLENGIYTIGNYL